MVFFRKERLFLSGVFRTMRSRQGPMCLPEASEECARRKICALWVVGVTLEQEIRGTINVITVCDARHRDVTDETVIFVKWSDAPHIEQQSLRFFRCFCGWNGVPNAGICRFGLQMAGVMVCRRCYKSIQGGTQGGH